VPNSRCGTSPLSPSIKEDYDAGRRGDAFRKLGKYMHEHTISPREMLDSKLVTDDCETAWMFLQFFITSATKGDMSVDAFLADCADHPVFKNYTKADFELVSKIFSRCQQLLRSKCVSTGSVIGLAGGASAGTAGVCAWWEHTGYQQGKHINFFILFY